MHRNAVQLERNRQSQIVAGTTTHQRNARPQRPIDTPQNLLLVSGQAVGKEHQQLVGALSVLSSVHRGRGANASPP